MRIVVFLTLTLTVAAGPGVAGKADSVSVVFLGNSHTYFHDLPGLVRGLVEAAGGVMTASWSTPGGCTFSYPPNAHLQNELSLGLLEAGGWDWVVLQEQSQFPCIPYMRDSYMFPGAFSLDSIARAHSPCAVTLLFMTWGHHHVGPWVETFAGYSSPEFDDYDQMQDSVAAAYLRLADSLMTPVAPVGLAWQNAHRGGVPLEVLFEPDEYHPALAGSYLAACVFYACLTQRSPVGLPFMAGLDESLAWDLQTVADSTVIPRLSEWNIDPSMPYHAFPFSWSMPAQKEEAALRGEMWRGNGHELDGPVAPCRRAVRHPMPAWPTRDRGALPEGESR